MDSLRSVRTPIFLVAAIIFCIYLYHRHGLMPRPLGPEANLWIVLISVWLLFSALPLVDYTIDRITSDALAMGNPLYPLSPSWVESVGKISADLVELRMNNDLDTVSGAKLQQAFTHRVEISYLMAYAEKGVYTSTSLHLIDDHLSKLTLAEVLFRRSLECALVSLHGLFMSIDKSLIEGSPLPEINIATTSLSTYVPELHVRLEEVAATHMTVEYLSLAFSQLCVISKQELKGLKAQMVDDQSVYTWISGNSFKAEAVSYAISIMETLSHEVCTGWKAVILVGKQVHQFSMILEQSMHHIIEDEDWTIDRSANFHGMLGKGIIGVRDLYEDLAFTRQQGDLFSS